MVLDQAAHTSALEILPVATDQPIEGRHTSLGGERRILLREVTSPHVSVRGSQGVCFAGAIASSNSFAFFAAANHLPWSPG
jgi:hypothetical protein